jgi:hypothetical protein
MRDRDWIPQDSIHYPVWVFKGFAYDFHTDSDFLMDFLYVATIDSLSIKPSLPSIERFGKK